MFNANEAVKIANSVRTKDNDRHPILNHMFLRFDDEGNARLEAISPYRAVRIALPTSAGAFNDAIQRHGGAKWEPRKGDKIDWQTFRENCVATSDKPHRLDEVFVTVGESKHILYPEVMYPSRRMVEELAYYDGQRKRPIGVVGLEVNPTGNRGERLELDIRRGMQLKDSRVSSFMGWEAKPKRLATVKRPKSIHDSTFEAMVDDGLGVYAAEYLSMFDEVESIGHSGSDFKPLAYTARGGAYEFIVMPIRMPRKR